MIIGTDGKKRCFGATPGKELLTDYHDNEWGIPSHNDKHLLEMIILEGAQAGLNWEIVLQKRKGYHKAFHNFNPAKVATMTDKELEALRNNPEIIRNRLKIYSTRQNAQAFIKIQKEFGSFDKYLWHFVNNKPIVNRWHAFSEVPANTPENDALSKDLKKTRHDICRIHDYLCLHASYRHGK